MSILKNSPLTHKFLFTAIMAAFAYAVMWNAMQFFPGLMYTVLDAHVVKIEKKHVTIELTRDVSLLLIATPASVTRKIVCANVVDIKGADLMITPRAGVLTERKILPLPVAAFNGEDVEECVYSGVITFWPLGKEWGPAVSVPWSTEPFTAERP